MTIKVPVPRRYRYRLGKVEPFVLLKALKLGPSFRCFPCICPSSDRNTSELPSELQLFATSPSSPMASGNPSNHKQPQT